MPKFGAFSFFCFEFPAKAYLGAYCTERAPMIFSDLLFSLYYNSVVARERVAASPCIACTILRNTKA